MCFFCIILRLFYDLGSIVFYYRFEFVIIYTTGKIIAVFFLLLQFIIWFFNISFFVSRNENALRIFLYSNVVLINSNINFHFICWQKKIQKNENFLLNSAFRPTLLNIATELIENFHLWNMSFGNFLFRKWQRQHKFKDKINICRNKNKSFNF